MTVLGQFLVLAAVVFAVNLLPAFGPPTWAVLVLFRLNWDLNPVALVLIGAVAAGAGRFLLALATRKVRHHLPKKRVESLQAAGTYLRGHKTRSILGLALFAVSPLPSAQLFEAAGLVDAPLVPLTASFFAGRLVSYSLYLSGASLAEQSFGDVFRSSLTSPTGIAVQVAMTVGVVLLARVDWARHLPGQARPATT